LIRLAFALLVAQAAAPRASFLDDLARQAYAAGDHARAYALFSEVHAVAPSPGTLFNMALNAELSGQPALAYALWSRYLAAPDAPDRADRARHRRDALARKLALVAVHTDPAGAEVFVDRDALGRVGIGPTTFPVAPGPHAIWARAPDHLEARGEVEARRGEVASLSLELPRRQGRLTIHTRPPSALELERAGTRRRARSGATSTVGVGRWQVVARREGFAPARLEVEVRPDADEVRRIALRPDARPAGWLLVSAGPERATLYVDGARRAPIPARVRVQGGLSEIELRRDGRVIWRDTVQITPGRSTVVWAELP